MRMNGGSLNRVVDEGKDSDPAFNMHTCMLSTEPQRDVLVRPDGLSIGRGGEDRGQQRQPRGAGPPLLLLRSMGVSRDHTLTSRGNG